MGTRTGEAAAIVVGGAEEHVELSKAEEEVVVETMVEVEVEVEDSVLWVEGGGVAVEIDVPSTDAPCVSMVIWKRLVC